MKDTKLMYSEDQYTMHYGNKSNLIRIHDNLNDSHITIPVHILMNMLDIHKCYMDYEDNEGK